jgi:hypothetical protein
MKIARKLLVSGGASLVIAGGVLALPLAQPASAMSVESLTKPLSSSVLKEDASSAFELKTEVDPGGHMLWATVTNKTDKSVTPHITFNKEAPLYESPNPIKPNESAKYAYAFTGNGFSVDVEVTGEGVETVRSAVTVNIQEPVSFKATETNDHVVIGTLRNNSTLVPQTVYTKTWNGSVKIEHLEPGEMRTIAIDHTAVDGQVTVGVTVATEAGYESTYAVKLGLVTNS